MVPIIGIPQCDEERMAQHQFANYQLQARVEWIPPGEAAQFGHRVARVR
jgi:hypothetical protein